MNAFAAQVAVPRFVRIKPGALGRLGTYARRHGHRRVALLVSDGLPADLLAAVTESLRSSDVAADDPVIVAEASFEAAGGILKEPASSADAIIGLGGGKAIDVAKYVAHLAARPFYAAPTSLSNDGFASPQSSLTLDGRRRSLPAACPAAVIIDTQVCLAAPQPLWWSGVGDLAAKLTAVRDWKIAYHETGEPVDDFAALLAGASVYQFLARPERDLEGIRLLGTALLLNGISMAICGSSRPASGSEHLISHALDSISARPRLHGLQVGLAAYVVSRLQGDSARTETIAGLFDRTGFWEGIRRDPFPRDEWLDAVRKAPSINPGRFTVLSTRDRVAEVADIINQDPRLATCFVSG